jgi:hypothetical protein
MSFRPFWGPTQPPSQWVLRGFPLGATLLRCEANYSPPTNAKVDNSGATPPFPHTYSWYSAQGQFYPFTEPPLNFSFVRKQMLVRSYTLFPLCFCYVALEQIYEHFNGAEYMNYMFQKSSVLFSCIKKWYYSCNNMQSSFYWILCNYIKTWLQKLLFWHHLE